MSLSINIAVCFRRVHRAARLLGVCLASTFAGAASAQESASDFLEPRLDRTQYEWLMKELGLERDQRMIAELLFTDYTTALGEAAVQADAAAEQAGRKSVENAMTGRARLSAEELQSLRVAVLQAYLPVGPAADVALDELLTGTHSLLTPEQEPSFAPAVRRLNRKLFLHPRQQSSTYEEYAGDGVDVLLLVEDALKDGGELQPIGRGPLADVLASYETQLDAILVETSTDWRSGKLAAKIAQVSKDPNEIARQRQAALDRWKRLYQLNLWAVQSIEQIVQAHAGDAAQQQWLDRFDRASFAWLYPRSRPERQFAWITKNVTDATQQQKAREMLDTYLAQRRDLARKAIEIMLRARMEFQTTLYAMMDPDSIDPAMRHGL